MFQDWETNPEILELAVVFQTGYAAEMHQKAELLAMLEDDTQRALLFQRSPEIAHQYESGNLDDLRAGAPMAAIAVGVAYVVKFALDRYRQENA